MKRWDGLVERYAAQLETRGLAKATIDGRERELVRFGSWLKARRPRPGLEELDADLVVRYVRSRSAFHSRSTVGSVVSSLRCMGEFLVAEGFWKSNPLRWMRGPKVDQRRHLPTRVGREDQQAIWEAAQKRPQEPGICFERCLGQLYARQSPSLERHGLDQLHQRRRERAARNLGQLCARHLGGGNVRGDPPLLHH